MIDDLPEVVRLAVDFHENLVQMPPPDRIGPHRTDTQITDLGGKHRSKLVLPKLDGFLADRDAALVQKILDVAAGERGPDIQRHRQTDDLGRGFGIAKWTSLCHPATLG